MGSLRSRPRDVDALYNRGIVLYRLQLFDEAISAFDQVLSREPRYIDALFERSNALAALVRFEEAAERVLAVNLATSAP
jgi:tetratricopeptide (TPR) repeat protein